MHQYQNLWVRDDVDRSVVDECHWHYDPGFDLLDNPSLIIDVGTHIGCFVAEAKQRFPDVEVIGIEPDAQNLGMAYLNVGDLDGVTLLDGAMGYYGPNMRVQRDVERTCNTRIHDTLLDGHQWGNEVRHVYIPELLITKPVDLIKFDCEGAEYHIFKNASPGVWQLVRAIVGEYHGAREEFDTRAMPFLQDHFDLSFYPPFNKHVGFFLGVNRAA